MARRQRKDLPDVSLYKTIFQARYEPHLKFYRLLIPAVQEFDEYPHWETDRLSVVLRDDERRCSLAIRHSSFAYDQDSDDVSLEEERVERALVELPKALEVSSYTRLGFRRQYLISVSMPFEELVPILNVKLLSQDEQLTKLMPAKVDDLLYRVDSSDDPLRFHLTVGPVRKQEIPEWITFNRAYHLKPGTRERDYLQILQAYPDVAVFVDLDVYRQEEGISTDEGLTFVKEARERQENIITHLRDYLFAKELED